MVNVRAAHIARLVELRAQCLLRGDFGMVAEIDSDLRRQGYDPMETTVAPTDVVEVAIPPRPRRGRPPKSSYVVAGRGGLAPPYAIDPPGQSRWEAAE